MASSVLIFPDFLCCRFVTAVPVRFPPGWLSSKSIILHIIWHISSSTKLTFRAARLDRTDKLRQVRTLDNCPSKLHFYDYLTFERREMLVKPNTLEEVL